MKVLHKVLFFFFFFLFSNEQSVIKPDHFRSLTPANKQESTVPEGDHVVCHMTSSELSQVLSARVRSMSVASVVFLRVGRVTEEARAAFG